MDRSKFEERFKIQSEIGQGQYGFVFKADDLVLQKPCAVKKITLKQVFGQNKQVEHQKTMLERELNILKNFEHENIVKLIEGCQDENEFLFALELCDQDLQSILQEKEKEQSSISEPDARVLFLQISEAMYYLSKNHVCHRDLQPANILLKNGVIKIADFGMGREINTAKSREQIEMTVRVGTPLYCSPDQNYDPYQLDVWSAGIILYEMIYGFLPYDLIKCQNKNELNEYLKGKELRFPEGVDVSSDAKELITFMLMKQPHMRYNWQQILNHKWILDEKKRVAGETNMRGSKRQRIVKNEESENLIKLYRLDFEIFNFLHTTLEMISRQQKYLNDFNLFRAHEVAYTCFGLAKLGISQYTIYLEPQTIREEYIDKYGEQGNLDFNKHVFEMINQQVKTNAEKFENLKERLRDYQKSLEEFYNIEEIRPQFEGLMARKNLQINIHNIIKRTFDKINQKEDETVLMILLHLSLFQQSSTWSIFEIESHIDLQEKLCQFQNLSNKEAIEIIHLK